MAQQKNKTIDPTTLNGLSLTVNTKSNVRHWQRKKICAFLIKLHIYKRFKREKPQVKVSQSLNEKIQKYNGHNLPSKYKLTLNFEKDGDQLIIHVDEFRTDK